MISLSTEPQFSTEDIYEIPAGVGRTDFEFDTNLIEVCHSLIQGCYDSHEVLAVKLVRAGVIRDSDMNLSTKSALIVRFKSQRASQTFIKRLNAYVGKCIKGCGMETEAHCRTDAGYRPPVKPMAAS